MDLQAKSYIMTYQAKEILLSKYYNIDEATAQYSYIIQMKRLKWSRMAVHVTVLLRLFSNGVLLLSHGGLPSLSVSFLLVCLCIIIERSKYNQS